MVEFRADYAGAVEAGMCVLPPVKKQLERLRSIRGRILRMAKKPVGRVFVDPVGGMLVDDDDALWAKQIDDLVECGRQIAYVV